MRIRVLERGLLTTVQDFGRPGYQAFGMSPAGAMDDYSFTVTNLLVHNDPGAAALEMTLKGGTYRFETPGIAAVGGADMRAKLDGERVSNWTAFPVREGNVLSFDFAKDGCRSYLALAGGIGTPRVLGSRSTYLKAGIGGLTGRALRAGDVLETEPPSLLHPLSPEKTGPVSEKSSPEDGKAIRQDLPPSYIPCFGSPIILRVLMGPQDDLFESGSIKTFLTSAYTISQDADRMGCRLEGPKIRHRGSADIVSDALARGSIQVPGNGAPIVMMADRQTTGGYPKIAVVIQADQHLLAQGKPGDMVCFAACTEEEALTALRERKSRLQILQTILEERSE